MNSARNLVACKHSVLDAGAALSLGLLLLP